MRDPASLLPPFDHLSDARVPTAAIAGQLRELDSAVFVTGWITPSALADLVPLGIHSVVNHRPDHEEPGQATSLDLAIAAKAAGLRYEHAPVSRMPDGHAVLTTERALAERGPDEGLVLFCKSGMRSTYAWALAQRRSGVSAESLRARAISAGYDLGALPL